MQFLPIKDTAKAIRKALAGHFPGVKFQVRGHQYSGGSSIYVNYTDGPLASEVEAVAKRFESCGFDGMQDLKYDLPTSLMDGHETRFCVDFVNVYRRLSAELLMLAAFQAHKQTRLPLLSVAVSYGMPELKGDSAQAQFLFGLDETTRLFYPDPAGDPHNRDYREMVYAYARVLPIYSNPNPKPMTDLPERLTPEYIDAQAAALIATAY